MLKEVRCGKCDKLLAKARGGIVEVKCRHCKTLNYYDGSAAERQTRAPAAPENNDNERRQTGNSL